MEWKEIVHLLMLSVYNVFALSTLDEFAFMRRKKGSNIPGNIVYFVALKILSLKCYYFSI